MGVSARHECSKPVINMTLSGVDAMQAHASGQRRLLPPGASASPTPPSMGLPPRLPAGLPHIPLIRLDIYFLHRSASNSSVLLSAAAKILESVIVIVVLLQVKEP